MASTNTHEDQIKALLPTYHRAVDELASFSFGSEVRVLYHPSLHPNLHPSLSTLAPHLQLFDGYLYIPLARTWPSEFRSALFTQEAALRQATAKGAHLHLPLYLVCPAGADLPHASAQRMSSIPWRLTVPCWTSTLSACTRKT